MDIPKHILDAIRNDETSLFNHTVLSNEHSKKNIIRGIAETFEALKLKTECDLSIKDNSHRLTELLEECKSIENGISSELVHIVTDYVRGKLFPNIDSYATLNLKLLEQPKPQKSKGQEDIEDFSFENLEEIETTTSYVYRKRLINVLITGLSLYYSNDYKHFIGKIFELNTRLPHLYSEINLYNMKLLYLFDETKLEGSELSDAYHDIYISGSKESKYDVKISGFTFSSLLYETIRAILHTIAYTTFNFREGLSEYIVSRTEAPIFECWDSRLGLPLVSKINLILEKNNVDLLDLNLGFFVQYLLTMPDEPFNRLFSELFAGTSKSEELLMDVVENIRVVSELMSELSKEEEFYTSEELQEETFLNENLHDKVKSSQSKSIASKRQWINSRLDKNDDDKYDHAQLAYHLYPKMDKDTARSLFSKKAKGKRKFNDEEIKKLYSRMKKGG